MKSKVFQEFKGLDLRRAEALSDEKTQRVAKNVYFTSGKKVKTRPGTRLRFTLPPETKGLFAASGVLRTICPDRGGFDSDEAFLDVFNRQRPNLFFDFYHVDPDIPGKGPATRFINAERFGASITAGVQPYAVIERLDERGFPRLEHQWFRDRPSTLAGDPGGLFVDNFVELPYPPSGMIIKTAQKLWAPDQINGAVRFSSTNFGPSDWSEEQDAGFLPVLANSPGDHTITALGTMQSTNGSLDNRQSALVVFFEDGIQIWAVDPDPLNHYLTGIIDGPGTENYRSVANVLGDPFFFSRRGFRSLRISARTGAMDTADIGAPIEELTQDIKPLEISASIWYERLGCYLCADGGTVYCLRYDPVRNQFAWSTWELPFQVEDLVDYNGALWARDTEGGVREFVDDYDSDDGEPIAFEFESQFHHLGSPGVYKTIQAASVFQQGAAALSYRPAASTPDVEVPVYTINGVTRPHEKIPILAMTDSIALRFAGTGRWQLDGYSLDYHHMGV